MTEIANFLRARYAEARVRENGKRRRKPSVFDGRDVEWQYQYENTTLLVDGHPFPEDQFFEIATEPAPDPNVLADLDAKLAIVDLCVDFLHDDEGGTDACAESTLCLLAQPYAGHPNYKGEKWKP
ncbi:DUF6221 family protein [Streptomyces bauhiniae]